MTTRTVTLSDADLAALSAIRPVVADAHQHPDQAAAIEALDRIAAAHDDGCGCTDCCRGKFGTIPPQAWGASPGVLVAQAPPAICSCLGCRTFHLGAAPAEGQDAHHTRLLLALDLSLAAACRSRGIPACNGQDGDDAQATDGCDIGTLHTRAGELAVELAAAIEEPSSTRQAERAGEALESLLAELRKVIGDRRRVS